MGPLANLFLPLTVVPGWFEPASASRFGVAAPPALLAVVVGRRLAADLPRGGGVS